MNSYDYDVYKVQEERIERAIERQMDLIDHRLMIGKLTQDQYDHEARKLDAWAQQQYSNIF